ncbi:MAG: iron-sulfur cluster assembly scaffold protein [Desulfobacterales bacterium]
MTDPRQSSESEDQLRAMLARTGYSAKAIDYYIRKPHMGSIENADQISEMVGTCGDSMTVFLKVDQGRIEDVKYQILGCAGSISAAMAAVDLVKGKTVEEALAVDDGDVFKSLEEIPAKKHHCIQLSVKALQKAIRAYQKSKGGQALISAEVPAGPPLAAGKGNGETACCKPSPGKGSCGGNGGGCCGHSGGPKIGN